MKKRLFFLLPVLPVVFFFSLFTFSANNIFAQEPESQVKISVRIIETGYHNIDDKGKNRMVWKFYKGNSHSQSDVLTNSKLETCFLVKSKKNNKVKEISEEKDDLKPFVANLSGFTITMEAFLNKKGGEKCIADAKDTYYGIKPEKIVPNNLASGVWSEEIKIEDAFGTFYSVIVYKYELLKGLDAIEFSGSSLINDASKNIVLGLPIKLPKKETLPFTWSYSIGDEESWKPMVNSAENRSKIDFNPLKDIFGNKQLTSAQKVNFKAGVEMGGKTESSDILTLTLVPPPPVFDNEKDIALIPVCNGAANGGIEIKNIKATASAIKYVLRRKTDATEPCNLMNPVAEECPGFVKAGSVAVNKALRIRDLEAGEYVLYIFNDGIGSGEINTPVHFTITGLPPLNVIDADPSVKEPTCTNEKGGEIYMNVEGAQNLWQIAIIPDKGTVTRDGNNITFKGLEAGKYTVYLSDQCGPEKIKTFNLKKPKQISIDIKDVSPLTDKTDFYIQLNVLNGSNDYKVKVTDQDNNITEHVFAFLPNTNIPINKTGIYNIEITDNSNPACPPARVKIKVDKPANTKAGKFKLKVLEE